RWHKERTTSLAFLALFWNLNSVYFEKAGYSHFLLQKTITTHQKPITLTENNSLTPVSNKSVEKSTKSNAISTNLEKTDLDKKESTVNSPSTDEIASDFSENRTEHSPKLEKLNSTIPVSRKRIASSPPAFAKFIFYKKKKNNYFMDSEKNFSEINPNSTFEKFSSSTNYTRSISMENNPIAPPSQPFSFVMYFTPTVDAPEWARALWLVFQ
ncbi:hypothetical protein K501DRAFT_281266, partial [Backusella circina FSU 941]